MKTRIFIGIVVGGTMLLGVCWCLRRLPGLVRPRIAPPDAVALGRNGESPKETVRDSAARQAQNGSRAGQASPGRLPSPVSAVKPEELSAAVRPIIGPQSGQSVGERMRAVWGLQSTGADAVALSQFLRRNGQIAGVDDNHLRALKNEIMDTLLKRLPADSGVIALLIDLYHDTAQDPVIRDYAIQHLRPAYVQAPTADGPGDSQAAIRQVLWEATGETDSSIAGTALLALREITDGTADGRARSPGVPLSSTAAPSDSADRVRLARTAWRLAADDHCGSLARTTALAVCGQMGVTEVLPVARQLAAVAPNIPIQLAAIAVLGDVGGTSEQSLLQQIRDTGGKRQQVAAQSALARMQRETRTRTALRTASIDMARVQ